MRPSRNAAARSCARLAAAVPAAGPARAPRCLRLLHDACCGARCRGAGFRRPLRCCGICCRARAGGAARQRPGCFLCRMMALADTLAALAPPETSIAIAWPDAVHVGGRLVGGGRLAWPRGAAEHGTPDWLVFAAIVRLASASGERSASHSMSTTLQDEGFAELGVEQLISGFARQLMVALDHWREGNFAGLARDYLVKSTRVPGACLAIDENGDLRIKRPGEPVTRCDLRLALESPSWLDPVMRVPRQ